MVARAAPTNRWGIRVPSFGLACEDRGETNTFNKRRCNQHRCLNLSVSFRLTGNRFHCATADHSDTDTGTDNGQTCTYYTWNFHKRRI